MPTSTFSRDKDDLTGPERVFALMEGAWAVERTIAPGGRFSGTATFEREGDDRLVYREKGVVDYDNFGRFTGERSYLYILAADHIEVRFHDGTNAGQHFVDLLFPEAPDAGWPIVSARDTHVCRLDNYETSYRFLSPDRFEITYVVKGPAKDYISQSLFQRTGV